MKKVFAILLALCAISVVISGCGGGDKAAETTTTGTAGTEETK